MARFLLGFRRRLLAASVPVVAVEYAWATLETAPSGWVFIGLVALAIPAALPSRLEVRVAVAVLTLLMLTLVTAGTSLGAIHDVVAQGLRDIYAVAPPFVPTAHPELHALVLLAACAFCLALAVTAGSKPFLAAAVAAGGVGWPRPSCRRATPSRWARSRCSRLSGRSSSTASGIDAVSSLGPQ